MNYFVNFFVGIWISIFLFNCSVPSSPILKPQFLSISARVRIADRPIELEVAKTPEQRSTGLMYRTSLADNKGMLFEFKPAQRVNFWMKNCKISLDMIFLKNGVVTGIQAKASPCTANPCPTYGPDTIVDQVIELRGGRTAELGLKVGDRIAIEFIGG